MCSAITTFLVLQLMLMMMIMMTARQQRRYLPIVDIYHNNYKFISLVITKSIQTQT